jgi:glycosyltransferase involved in cell wall biosynthesis
VVQVSAIDIVIGTRNRLAMLQRTIECIRERTTTPYQLTVIDDASTDGTAEYVKSLEGVRLHRHAAQQGMHGNLRDVVKLTTSDPVICTDDDALCPLLEPDWLARLLEAMKARPKLMMLGLNNPGDNVRGNRHPYADDGTVVLSEYVSGHFLAMRRRLLEVTPKLFVKEAARKSPNKTQARWVRSHGGQVGYLRDVYTWHFCPESIRRPGKTWHRIMVEPIDMVTLEPPEEYRQWTPKAS